MPGAAMADITLYEREDGRAPFADWFDALDPVAAAKITIAVEKMRFGNLSALEAVGGGVQDFWID